MAHQAAYHVLSFDIVVLLHNLAIAAVTIGPLILGYVVGAGSYSCRTRENATLLGLGLIRC